MYPVIPLSDVKAVGAASVAFDLTMIVNQTYLLTSSTACWAAQGAAPVAVAAADANLYVPAGVPTKIRGDHGAKLALIQAAAGGFASLVPIQE